MATSSRKSSLETRTARAKIKPGKRVYASVSKSLALGYYRGKNGGTWCLREGLPGNKYATKNIGIADDHREADGITVLTYFQAQEKVRNLTGLESARNVHYTVGHAATDYLNWFQINRKSYTATKRSIDRHILSQFKDRLITSLTTEELNTWRDNLIFTKTKAAITEEEIRKRKCTANRILTILKAILNRAWENKDAIQSNQIWAKVKKFSHVDKADVHFYSEAECTRLVNACDADFRKLVQAALFSGSRFGELIQTECRDYNPQSGTICFRHTKSGKVRHTPLNAEGQEFFNKQVIGKLGGDFIFTQGNGKQWKSGQQGRYMAEASKQAKIMPAANFKSLRNSYGAFLAGSDVSLQVVASLLGHSDTRVTEKFYAHLKSDYVAESLRSNLPSFGAGAKAQSNVVSIGDK